MTELTKESLHLLLSDHQAPCLSLYQRTHRSLPHRDEGPIRFRNLVRELESSVRRTHPQAEVRRLMKPFAGLARDHDFWNHTLEGLAVLASPDSFLVYRLPRPVRDLVVVADSFHLKPLWRLLQSVERYQVLAVTLEGVRLFEGDRDRLGEVELAAEVPRTFDDTRGLGSTHGGEAKADALHLDTDSDTDRFFRAIDRAVLERHSRPAGLPLVLAALGEHHHRFRSLSHNPLLIAEGITINPDALTTDGLRERAWQVIEPRYRARVEALRDAFARARATGSGSDDLAEIGVAAAASRVAMLYIEADRQVAGHLDETTGVVSGGVLADPSVDDVLDDLGELVIKMGGEVLVIGRDGMPTGSSVAAIYRY